MPLPPAPSNPFFINNFMKIVYEIIIFFLLNNNCRDRRDEALLAQPGTRLLQRGESPHTKVGHNPHKWWENPPNTHLAQVRSLVARESREILGHQANGPVCYEISSTNGTI